MALPHIEVFFNFITKGYISVGMNDIHQIRNYLNVPKVYTQVKSITIHKYE